VTWLRKLPAGGQPPTGARPIPAVGPVRPVEDGFRCPRNRIGPDRTEPQTPSRAIPDRAPPPDPAHAPAHHPKTDRYWPALSRGRTCAVAPPLTYLAMPPTKPATVNFSGGHGYVAGGGEGAIEVAHDLHLAAHVQRYHPAPA
jgi:hypothetical protein